jgi:membrane-bound lytic murein transglycosylase B
VTSDLLPRAVAAGTALAVLGVVGATAARMAAQPHPPLSALPGPGSQAAPPLPGTPRRVGPPSRGAPRAAVVSGPWVRATAERTGIPGTAVQAYGQATLDLARSSPGCRLSWVTLAGIGWVESQHGTVGGRRLRANGYSTSRILGPPLDGRRYAAIPATPASTRLHGDPRWDHAVGPMQFIPSTWARWATDGDGNGVRDPNDLFDASLATARYLCAHGLDLGTGTGWSAAVRSYNHSDAYVADVFRVATGYANAASR